MRASGARAGVQPALPGVSEGWKVSGRGWVKRRVEGSEGRRHTPEVRELGSGGRGGGQQPCGQGAGGEAVGRPGEVVKMGRRVTKTFPPPAAESRKVRRLRGAVSSIVPGLLQEAFLVSSSSQGCFILLIIPERFEAAFTTWLSNSFSKDSYGGDVTTICRRRVVT